MINNNNNRSIGLIVFHVICLITYLVCIPLSIYGYYTYFSSLSLTNLVGSIVTGTVAQRFTWLYVAISLDVLVVVLSIVQCCVGCICGCMYSKNRSVQPIFVTPTVAVSTIPQSTYNRPPANPDDKQHIVEMQQYKNVENN